MVSRAKALLHKSLGDYLRKKRIEAGLSQVELARELGYTSQFVTNWERGASSPPANSMRKLVETLSIPEPELLELLCRESMNYWERVLSVSNKRRKKIAN